MNDKTFYGIFYAVMAVLWIFVYVSAIGMLYMTMDLGYYWGSALIATIYILWAWLVWYCERNPPRENA